MPLKRMLPALGRTVSRIMRASVVLPLPDSPMIARISGPLGRRGRSSRRRPRACCGAEQPPPGVTAHDVLELRAAAAHVMRRATGLTAEAGHAMARRHVGASGGTCARADVHRQRAARDGSGSRSADRRGSAARPPAALGSVVAPMPRQAGDQMRGVGMARRRTDVWRSALLDQAAGVHHAEPVARGWHAPPCRG